MTRALIHVLTAGLLLALAAVANAQELSFTLDKTSGGIGTEVTLTLAEGGFGSKKGKVSLTPAVINKRRKKPSAKVTSWSDTTVVFEVSKAPAGLVDVTVKTKSKPKQTLVGQAAFTVLGPTVSDVNPPQAGRKEVVTISGAHFGPKKGKVRLDAVVPGKKKGGKKPKVLSWSNTTIELRLPKKISDADYRVVVINAAGESTSDAGVEITTPDAPITGPDQMDARIDRDRMAAQDGNSGDSITLDLGRGTEFTLQGTDTVSGRDAVVHTLAITLDPGVDFSSIERGRLRADQVVSVTYTTDGGLDYSAAGADFDVTIDRRVGDRIQISFDGTLTRNAGPGPATLDVRGGRATGTLSGR